jgi:hypothetical protein
MSQIAFQLLRHRLGLGSGGKALQEILGLVMQFRASVGGKAGSPWSPKA